MLRLPTTLIVAVFVASCSSKTEESAAPKAPLFDNLGNLHHEITTASPEAQRYFDQGMTLSYAFNHAEAIRSFRQAAALDPGCAMCYWGVAFALGPNINAPITPEAAKEAFDAIAQARQRAAKASAKEQAYIEALAKRYASDPKADRPPLDAAYAAAMRDVVAKFPDDLDATTLFAQSLMDTSPWNYWNADGTPRSFTNEVLASLESVLKRKSDHLGAIHLYIHAVEASPNPGRAEQYADRLPALAPGAGHLVHMPAHIYLRTGRYSDASRVNEDAMRVDAAYNAGGNAVPNNMTYQIGYVPHNPHFFVASASLEGRRADALRAADDVRSKMHSEMLRDPSMGGMVQHFMLTPLFTKVRFAMWDEVLAEPVPPADLPYMQAISHAARTMAYAARGDFNAAEKELAAMTAKDDPSLKTLYMSTVNLASAIASIAYEVASGELLAHQKRAGDAARHFAAALAVEDGLTYMEPPDWPIPVRQLQGAALLALGRAGEAEAAFRGDLKKFPNNGWSLSGLRESVGRQGPGRAAEATALDTQLKESWKRADVKVVGARVMATN